MNKKQLMKYCFMLSAAASGITLYLSFTGLESRGLLFYLGIALAIIFALLALFFRGRVKLYAYQENVSNNWGKKIERKRNMKGAKNLFEYLKLEEKGFFLDDQTWEDLNMDDIFKLLDRTLTSPGEQFLYKMLRHPLFSDELIKKRGKLIEYFQENSWARTKIQVELAKLDRQSKGDITALLWENPPEKSPLGIVLNILFVCTLLSIGSIYFIGVTGAAPLLLAMFMINTSLHYKIQKGIEARTTLIRYLGSIIKTSRNVSELLREELSSFKSELKQTSESCFKIYRKTSNIGNIKGLDVFGDYLSIIFLIEERSYFKVAHEIRTKLEELKRMYLALGELDALISVASYRSGLDKYSEPEFLYGASEIQVKNIVHPLLSEAVPNSITINNGGIVITGSNMSGKSTFLRTLGVNAVFAQTIATCLGESYSASYFKVLTSISPNDNILGGKSYYIGEAESLLRIINSCEENTATLCIVDEIFRGTNPVERVNAAAEILNFLAKHNTLSIVATHDLELTEMVEKDYEAYYFSEDVGEEGLKFDYHIKKGVSPTRNAIKLLAYLGYPEEIIESTNRRIEAVEKSVLEEAATEGNV